MAGPNSETHTKGPEEHYKTVSRCRLCRSGRFAEVLSFAPQYIASTFVKDNDDYPLSKLKFPLTLLLCEDCGAVQLRETVDPDVLYTNYFYRSAVNETMRRDLREVVDEVVAAARARPGDRVVDIGANDCTTIGMYPADLERVAVEPAKNISWAHVDRSITIVNDYFSREAVLEATGGRKVQAMSSTAMFYDIDDPNRAAADIKALLTPDGVCTIQVSHLYFTIRDMNFYDICHEHLLYYSLETIRFLMERNGLALFDAKTNFVNGGSLRILVTHKEANRPVSPNVDRLLVEESALKLRDRATYERFGAQIGDLATRARNFIVNEVQAGRLVIGLGASTKGNVLLQLCRIDRSILPYISERNPEKVGLRTMGMDIELISEQAARDMDPSAMLVIPWNFKDEIVKREQEYLRKGGRLIFLMPYAYYLDRHGETRL